MYVVTYHCYTVVYRPDTCIMSMLIASDAMVRGVAVRVSSSVSRHIKRRVSTLNKKWYTSLESKHHTHALSTLFVVSCTL